MDDTIRGIGEIALRKNAPVDKVIEALKEVFTDVRLSGSERPVVFVAAFDGYGRVRRVETEGTSCRTARLTG